MPKAVRVPAAFEPLFNLAEGFVEGLFAKLVRRPEQGSLHVGEDRYVLMRAESFYLAWSEADRVKLLWKDQSGWCLLYKRLDARLVIRPLAASPSSSPLVTIDGRTLAALLEGVARVQGEKAKDFAKKSRDRALSMIESMSTATT